MARKRTRPMDLRRVTSYLLPDEHDWVIKSAEQHGRSVSTFIAGLVAEAMMKETAQAWEAEAATRDLEKEALPW